MKYLILLFQILVVTESSSQNFKFRYSELGLGSNRYSNYPELHVTINDTLLVYQHIFTVRILEFDSLLNVESTVKDSSAGITSLSFRRSSIDSLRQIMAVYAGKSIYATNPYIMSGAIQYFDFEFDDQCIQFQLKNTDDSTITSAVRIINYYLPEDYKIGTFIIDNPDYFRSIENCRGLEQSTYPEILGKEYEALRQRGDEQMNTEKPPLITLMDGLYKSNPNSFRNNFYIKITGDTVTLFGWQTGVDNDTVYFKSRTVNTSKEEGWVIWIFEQFKFSSEPIINDNIDGFKENKKIDPFTGTLHNYFLGTYAEGVFKLIATTNIYDSRADVFEFEKIQ